jgi:ribonuclease I
MRSKDPFRVRPRRRRRSMTLVGLVVTALSALIYQYSSKPGVQSSQSQSRPTPKSERSANSARDTARSIPGSFDFYFLALSLAPAFCEDGHQNKGECRSLDAKTFAATPLTLHGLWPENNQPQSYPRDCDGPQLRVSAATRKAMERWMPGAADGLDKHEWIKHGTCSGLSADDYFGSSMRLVEQVNTAVGPAIRKAAGGSMDAATLRAAANASHSGMGESLVFVCKNLRRAPDEQRRKPYLMEIRVCVENDGPAGAPQSLMQCAAVQRRDQGCGASFQIDSP